MLFSATLRGSKAGSKAIREVANFFTEVAESIGHEKAPIDIRASEINLLVYESWELGSRLAMLPWRFDALLVPVGASSNPKSSASRTCTLERALGNEHLCAST